MSRTERPPVPLSEKLLLTIPEVCDVMGIGEKTLRGLIREGELASVRFGTAVRFKRADVEKFVGELQPDRLIADLPDWIQDLAQEGKGRRK